MDLIQNELINKAFTLGFKSYFGLMTSVNKECYHLWMNDLQKWLREAHNIHIQIIFLPINNRFIFAIYKYGEDDIESVVEYETYELALEAALQEALKLI